MRRLAFSPAGVRLIRRRAADPWQQIVATRQFGASAAIANLSGAASIALAGAAAVQGLGALDGAVAPASFAATGILTGAGQIAGTASVATAATGTVVGRGTVSGGTGAAFTPSGAVTGLGQLAGSSAATLTASGGVFGRGALVGSSTVALSAAGTAGAAGAFGGASGHPVTTVDFTNQVMGYTVKTFSGLPDNSVIALTGSTFKNNNSKNAAPTATNTCSVGTDPILMWPLEFTNCGSGLYVHGGTVWGNVPQAYDHGATYCGSAVGFRFENCPGENIATGGPTLKGFRLDKVWDGVRLIKSNGALIERGYAKDVRDDFIENDEQGSITVRNCLVDGCLSFIACAPSTNRPHITTGPGADAVVNGVVYKRQHMLLENNLVRMKLCNQGGNMTHGALMKYATDEFTPTNPTVTMVNNVWALEDNTPAGSDRVAEVWKALTPTGNSGNLIINLTASPLASATGSVGNAPAHAGVTYVNKDGTQQAAAQAQWASLKQMWLDANPDLAGTEAGQAGLTGSATIKLSPTGALLGRGALSGSTLVSSSGSATLTTAGTLSGQTALSTTAFGTLAGKGRLSGAAAATFGATGALTADEGLRGNATFLVVAAGSLSSTPAALVGAALITIRATGALSNVSPWSETSAPSSDWTMVEPANDDWQASAPQPGEWGVAPRATGTWS